MSASLAEWILDDDFGDLPELSELSESTPNEPSTASMHDEAPGDSAATVAALAPSANADHVVANIELAKLRAAASAKAYRACDCCRRLRERCVPTPTGTCAGCTRRKKTCTFDLPWRVRGRAKRKADDDDESIGESQAKRRKATTNEQAFAVAAAAPALSAQANQLVCSTIGLGLVDVFCANSLYMLTSLVRERETVAAGMDLLGDDVRFKLVAMAFTASAAAGLREAAVQTELEVRRLAGACVGVRSKHACLAHLLLHMHFQAEDRARSRMHLLLSRAASTTSAIGVATRPKYAPYDARSFVEHARVAVEHEGTTHLLLMPAGQDTGTPDLDSATRLIVLSEVDVSQTVLSPNVGRSLLEGLPFLVNFFLEPVLADEHAHAQLERAMMSEFGRFSDVLSVTAPTDAALQRMRRAQPRAELDVVIGNLRMSDTHTRISDDRAAIFGHDNRTNKLFRLLDRVAIGKYDYVCGQSSASWLLAAQQLLAVVFELDEIMRDLSHFMCIPHLACSLHAACIAGDTVLAMQALCVLEGLAARRLRDLSLAATSAFVFAMC